MHYYPEALAASPRLHQHHRCTPILFLDLLPKVHATTGGIWQQYTYNGSAGSRPYFVYTPANYQLGTIVP